MGGDDQLRPFVFGNYGIMVFGGDAADSNVSVSVCKGGVGVVTPVGERWGVVAQTGLIRKTTKDDWGKTTDTATFCALGVRYSF